MTDARTTISSVLRTLRDAWLARGEATDAQGINRGLCEEFAWEAIDVLAVHGMVAVERDAFDDGYPGHVWIEAEGRHYDAEACAGVADWRELPLFVRSRAKEATRAVRRPSPAQSECALPEP